MALTLTGAGSLFVKLGHMGGILLDLNAARGTTATPTAPDYTVLLPTKIDTLGADFSNGTAERAAFDGFYTNMKQWQQSQDTLASQLQALAQFVTIDMVNVDTAQQDRSLATAMKALIVTSFGLSSAYGGATYKVTASTLGVGAQANLGNPTGSFAAAGNSGPVLIVDTKDGHGLGLDYMLAETLTALVTADAVSGSATKWQEPILLKGSGNLARTQLDYLWPSGSGQQVVLNCVDAALSNSGSAPNVLYNSETWTNTTANYPDNWVIITGAATTNILVAATGYRDALSLQFLSAGGVKPDIKQPFNTAASTGAGSGGTPFNILKYGGQSFAVNFWVKLSSGTPTNGTLTVSLCDGSNTTINDDTATANTVDIDLRAINSTTWRRQKVVFRFPTAVPAAAALRFALTGTVLDNGLSCYIDLVGMTPMGQLYAGGPKVAAFSANVQPIVNDAWTLATTNTWGGFQQLAQRFFDMRSLGLRLPTAGAGAAINDNLIA